MIVQRDDNLGAMLIDSTPLREWVNHLPNRDEAFATWGNSGLPPARDRDGNSVMLRDDIVSQIASIIRSHDHSEATPGLRRALIAKLELMLSDAQRRDVKVVARALGMHFGNMLMTEGVVLALAKVMDMMLEAEPNIPDLPDPPVKEAGSVLNVAVSSGEELDLIPPTGTIKVVMSWVGGDRKRATAALNAELAGKNRKGIVSKLMPLADAPHDGGQPLALAVPDPDEEIARIARRVEQAINDINKKTSLEGT